MTNDLKNFLEENIKELFDKKLVTKQLPNGYRELLGEQVNMSLLWNLYDAIKDHDTRLINFILELVAKEVDKKYDIDYNMQDEPFRANNLYNEALDDVSTIINSLKV